MGGLMAKKVKGPQAVLESLTAQLEARFDVTFDTFR